MEADTDEQWKKQKPQDWSEEGAVILGRSFMFRARMQTMPQQDLEDAAFQHRCSIKDLAICSSN